MEEVWKDIPGYEGSYQASSEGRIRSLDRTVNSGYGSNRVKKGRILKNKTDKDGYPIVNLSVQQKVKTCKVYRLVWETFNGPIPDGMHCNHINEIKTDCRLENLNLMTARENNRWGTRTERAAKSYSLSQKGKQLYQDNPKARMIMEYKEDGTPFCLWLSMKGAAEHYNMHYTTIWNNLNGKTKALKDGTYFRYIERETV